MVKSAFTGRIGYTLIADKQNVMPNYTRVHFDPGNIIQRDKIDFVPTHQYNVYYALDASGHILKINN